MPAGQLWPDETAPGNQSVTPLTLTQKYLGLSKHSNIIGKGVKRMPGEALTFDIADISLKRQSKFNITRKFSIEKS